MAKSWEKCSPERGLHLCKDRGWFTSTQIVEMLIGPRKSADKEQWAACQNSVYKRLWRIFQDHLSAATSPFDESEVLQVDSMILKEIDGELVAVPGGQGQVIAHPETAQWVIDEMSASPKPIAAEEDVLIPKTAISDAIGRGVSGHAIGSWVDRFVRDEDKSLIQVREKDLLKTWHVRRSVARRLIDHAASLPSLKRGWWVNCDPYAEDAAEKAPEAPADSHDAPAALVLVKLANGAQEAICNGMLSDAWDCIRTELCECGNVTVAMWLIDRWASVDAQTADKLLALAMEGGR